MFTVCVYKCSWRLLADISTPTGPIFGRINHQFPEETSSMSSCVLSGGSVATDTQLKLTSSQGPTNSTNGLVGGNAVAVHQCAVSVARGHWRLVRPRRDAIVFACDAITTTTTTNVRTQTTNVKRRHLPKIYTTVESSPVSLDVRNSVMRIGLHSDQATLSRHPHILHQHSLLYVSL